MRHSLVYLLILTLICNASRESDPGFILKGSADRAERLFEITNSINKLNFQTAASQLVNHVKLYPVVTEQESLILNQVFKHLLEADRAILLGLEVELGQGIKSSMSSSQKLQVLSRARDGVVSTSNSLIAILDKLILPNLGVRDQRIKTICLTMKGDFLRYQSEAMEGRRQKEQFWEAARWAYKEAGFSALRNPSRLPSDDPVLLRLNLREAILLYELMGLKSQGILVLEEALHNVATMSGNLRGKFPADNIIKRDSQYLITLMQNHLKRWVGESITVELQKEKDWVFVGKGV